jgi:hypothetical protein
MGYGYEAQGLCVQCKAVKFLNVFRSCKECFLGWTENDGIHCNLCPLIIPAQSEESARTLLDKEFKQHLRDAHDRVADLTLTPPARV